MNAWSWIGLFALAASGCAADDTLHLRLLTTLSSQTSLDGADFDTVVTADWPRFGPVSIPSGSRVSGKVLRARNVGLALRREHALLELGFAEYTLPDGTRHPLWAALSSLDNSRETVRDGNIRGVHAASGPAGWIQGLWISPRALLTPAGLTGVVGLSGVIGSKLPLGPVGDLGILLIRGLMFRLPKTEIRLPVGTDLKIAVTNLGPGHPEFLPDLQTQLSSDQHLWLAGQPAVVTEPSGKPIVDQINVALSGSLEEVMQALVGAGWSPADSLSRETFGRAYKAFTSMSGYRTAPVSPIHYRKGMPDLVFEKSFNSMAKRHHIRLWWAGEQEGREIWLGAASHDVVVTFKKWPITFTHRIDPRIDIERERVVEDLRFAGCADGASYVERPELETAQATGNTAETDGRLALLSVHVCTKPQAPLDAAAAPDEAQDPRLKRLFRRLILEARFHLVQGNIYYKGLQLMLGHNALLPQE